MIQSRLYPNTQRNKIQLLRSQDLGFVLIIIFLKTFLGNQSEKQKSEDTSTDVAHWLGLRIHQLSLAKFWRTRLVIELQTTKNSNSGQICSVSNAHQQYNSVAKKFLAREKPSQRETCPYPFDSATQHFTCEICRDCLEVFFKKIIFFLFLKNYF